MSLPTVLSQQLNKSKHRTEIRVTINYTTDTELHETYSIYWWHYKRHNEKKLTNIAFPGAVIHTIAVIADGTFSSSVTIIAVVSTYWNKKTIVYQSRNAGLKAKPYYRFLHYNATPTHHTNTITATTTRYFLHHHY